MDGEPVLRATGKGLELDLLEIKSGADGECRGKAALLVSACCGVLWGDFCLLCCRG